MTQIILKYGVEKLPFDIPDSADVFHISDPEKNITPAGFAGRIEAELKRLEPDLSNVAIVLGDKTRVCGYTEYLPVLLGTLEHFGANPDNISLFVAYGTHVRQSDDESYTAYGDSYRKYRFIHHDCTDEALFLHKGHTSRGTRVMIRRDIANASFLITFGAISHHYFAGYGGGRKLIFPGLGFRNSIYHNHGLFLDRETGTLASACQPGILDGNPLAEDLEAFESFRPADMAIHGILNSKGAVCDLLPGSGTAHFRSVCAEHGRNCEKTVSQEYEWVIASCGGHPKDINFIQSHKAIHNAATFVRDNGTLIMLARCREGVGSETFLPWFEAGGWKAAFDKLAENYEGNGGTALSMMSKSQRIRIRMVTELEDAVTQTIRVRKISAEQAGKQIRESAGSVAVIPNAGLLVKK